MSYLSHVGVHGYNSVQHIVLCVLFGLSLSCVLNVASFSELSVLD